MVSTTTFLFAALAAVVSAAPGCAPPVTFTLPKIGGGTELVAPAANLVLKKIAIGHGIQNYTCGTTTDDAKATGAVAVLYDATGLYPGTKKTGLKQREWDSAPSTLLWHSPLPLNKLVGSKYGADLANPFPDPAADLSCPGLPAAKYMGHHFFDSQGTPVFELPAVGLAAVVGKVDGITAPASADKGIIDTGAVAWLQLDDNLSGKSKGVTSVYRVVTAGGAAQPCSVAGAGVQSVPYATYYWFFG
ncbi:hypothetical protein C8A00DRAFT_36214 [Chaetomidium leptoderma]|uniref:Malate dehydrogenase n=1 Tax=Chaetomidium leptoderma TaxID=669021 RepID=A0AAN6VIP1_9PEZI|nr:hypothetical protein C8A00DRAFT_36214 [Chaetomidium leptoderma]